MIIDVKENKRYVIQKCDKCGIYTSMLNKKDAKYKLQKLGWVITSNIVKCKFCEGK